MASQVLAVGKVGSFTCTLSGALEYIMVLVYLLLCDFSAFDYVFK